MEGSASGRTRTDPFLLLGAWRIVLLALIIVTRIFWKRWEFEYGFFFAVPTTFMYFVAPLVAAVDVIVAAVDRRHGRITWTAFLIRLGWAVAIIVNLVLSFVG